MGERSAKASSEGYHPSELPVAAYVSAGEQEERERFGYGCLADVSTSS